MGGTELRGDEGHSRPKATAGVWAGRAAPGCPAPEGIRSAPGNFTNTGPQHPLLVRPGLRADHG